MTRRIITTILSMALVGCTIDDGRPSREEIRALKSETLPPRLDVPTPSPPPVEIDVKAELEKAKAEGREKDEEILKKIQELMKQMDEKAAPVQQVAPLDEVQTRSINAVQDLLLRVENLEHQARTLKSAPQRSDFDVFLESIAGSIENTVTERPFVLFLSRRLGCLHCPPAWAELEPELKKRGIPYKVVYQEEDVDNVFNEFSVDRTPTTVLVDPRTKKSMGKVEGRDLRKVLKMLDDQGRTFSAIPVGKVKMNEVYTKLAGTTKTFGNVTMKIPDDTSWAATYKDGVRDIEFKKPITLEIQKFGKWTVPLTGFAFTTDMAVARLGGLLVPDIRAGADWSSP